MFVCQQLKRQKNAEKGHNSQEMPQKISQSDGFTYRTKLYALRQNRYPSSHPPCDRISISMPCSSVACHGKIGPGIYGPVCTILPLKYYARSQLNLRGLVLGLGLGLCLRLRLRLGLGLWLALGLGLGSVFTFKRPDRFCRRTKFTVTGYISRTRGNKKVLYFLNGGNITDYIVIILL